MPNWVTMTMTLTGPAKTLKRFRDENKGKVVGYGSKDDRDTNESSNEPSDLSFQHLLPMPKDLVGTTSPVPDTVSQQERRRLKSLYGADNWYDWSVNNWGTKWDACDPSVSDNDTPLEYNFQTAWSLPIPWFNAVSKAYPDLNIEIVAEEESGAFYGKVIYSAKTKRWKTVTWTADEYYYKTNPDYAAVADEIKDMPYDRFLKEFATKDVWFEDEYPNIHLEARLLARFKKGDLPLLVGHEWSNSDNQTKFEKRLKGTK